MTARVHAIGDSVMQGAGPDLYATLPIAIPGIEVDAVPSRQFREAPGLVRARVGVDPLPDLLVIHLGTNGAFADSSFDELMRAADRIAQVVFVTVKAPRDWEHGVNERLGDGVVRHAPRASLVDWNATATECRDHLRPDGFHLSRTGARAYAEAIAGCVRCLDERAGSGR
jgi:lysophospholipase L1-like esterase